MSIELKLEDFKNDWTGDNITGKDFEFFESVYKWLDIKTLGEYHDLYLKSDVLPLADVYENEMFMMFMMWTLQWHHHLVYSISILKPAGF